MYTYTERTDKDMNKYWQMMQYAANDAMACVEEDKEGPTSEYMEVWNNKQDLERALVLAYAAEKLAEKVAHSDYCLEAFK